MIRFYDFVAGWRPATAECGRYWDAAVKRYPGEKDSKAASYKGSWRASVSKEFDAR